MPGFDRTGPLGQGPMTGRGFGPCGRGLGWRRGFGRGFGFGLGRGWGIGRSFGWGAAPAPRQTQKQDLEDYRKSLKEELEAVEKEMAEMDREA
jgi:hypothetical protein